MGMVQRNTDGAIIEFIHLFLLGVTQKANKWKNHFSEMKEDVGVSRHEKESEQEDAYTKRDAHS